MTNPRRRCAAALLMTIRAGAARRRSLASLRALGWLDRRARVPESDDDELELFREPDSDAGGSSALDPERDQPARALSPSIRPGPDEEPLAPRPLRVLA